MKEQINDKCIEFKNQIRRKQREALFKKNRQQILKEIRKQKQQGQAAKKMQSMEMCTELTQQIAQNSVKGLLAAFTRQDNYMESVPEKMLPDIMKLITSKQSLQTMEGIRLVGLFVQFCGSQDPKAQDKVQIIRESLEEAQIEQTIFVMIQRSMHQSDIQKIKMLLFCLRNMAYIRMERIRDKQLLQIYLLPIIQHYIGESSTMIFLCYVSQIYPFSTDVIKIVCEQSTSTQKVSKIVICTILSNYITLQENQQSVHMLFELILKTLMDIFMKLKAQAQKYSIAAIQPIFKLMARYPEGRGRQLLARVQSSRLHALIMIFLTVGSAQLKQIAYDIEQAIIDKSISELRQQFFSLFNSDILYQLITEINSTNANSIQRSLKIIVKILHHASPHFAKQLQANHNLNYVLENLSYHKNEYISEIATHVMNDLATLIAKTNQMNDD